MKRSRRTPSAAVTSLTALVAGWASLTAGIAALTTPWAWAISAGVALLSYGALMGAAAVHEERESTPQDPEEADE